MRLLQRNNDSKYSLTEFTGEDIPRYAILSHTWGADHNEVTLADLEKDTGTSKAGYRKLQFCADQAAKHGLRYFWVDTCCIGNVAQMTTPHESGGFYRQKRWPWRCLFAKTYRKRAYSVPSLDPKLFVTVHKLV